MQNNINNTLTIAGKTQLELVVKYKTNACYQVHINIIDATTSNVHCSVLWDLMTSNSLAESNKTVFDNEITCYENPNAVGKLAIVTKQFEPSIWTNIRITVNLPKDLLQF